MTDQENRPSDSDDLSLQSNASAPHSDVDSNGIPILNDVVEEVVETEPQPDAISNGTTPSASPDSTTYESTEQPIEINEIKAILKEELTEELNELILSTLIDATEEISSKVGGIVEDKLSDALQKKMGELLKTTLEEKFKSNKA